jgi:cytochrome c oxidase assembly protein subunit 15
MNQALKHTQQKESDQWIAVARMLANVSLLLVLVVILMGGWTRINNAGLSCPDWPGCFGQLTVPNTQQELRNAADNFPSVAVEQSKSWLEMIHRYLAGSLGLLILTMAFIAIKKRKQKNYPVKLSITLLVLVVFQALLGMWTVTLKLLPIIVTAHLFGGLLTMVLLIIVRRHIHKIIQVKLRWSNYSKALALGLFLLVLQVLLGGWTSSNYAGWGCSDWMGCNPKIAIEYNYIGAFKVTLDSSVSHQGGTLQLAERGAIQIVHRLGAAIVLLYFTGLLILCRKKEEYRSLILLTVLFTAQIVVGLMNIAFAIPTLLAMLHHILAVFILMITTLMLANSFHRVARD